MSDTYRREVWILLSNQLCTTLLIMNRWMKEEPYRSNLAKVRDDTIEKFSALRKEDSPFNCDPLRTYLKLPFGLTLLSDFLAGPLSRGLAEKYKEIDLWITRGSASDNSACVHSLDVDLIG